MDKAAEALYAEREKRLMDTIELKIPDRIPIVAPLGYFPARYTGISCEAAWYDFDKWREASMRTLRDFQPDFCAPQGFFPGKAMEYIQPNSLRWPGHGVSPNHSHQSVESEIMRADEYDAFLKDPSDYMFRIFTPRTSGATTGLQKLPRLTDMGGGHMGVQMLAEALARPEVAESIAQLQKAGQEIIKWRPKMFAFAREIESLGFPPFTNGYAMVPFDGLSHSMRGMKGSFLDLYRQPDKVIAACEKILEQTFDKPMPPPTRGGHMRIFMPLTRGSDDFMSLKQWDKFYWPHLKRLVQFFIDRGAIPCPFFEGNFTSRLEYLLDLPKGKICAQFDTTDIFKAKEILKGHMCIRGNVPPSLLQVGTVQEVQDYCKKLIDVCGKDGGFVLSPRSSTDEVNPENFKAMIEFTREYGRYR